MFLKKYGLRKAKNKTTLVGCELGTVKKAVVGTALVAAIALPSSVSGIVSADEVTEPTTVQVEPEATADEGTTPAVETPAPVTQEIPVQSGENTLEFTIDSTTSVESKPRNIIVMRDDSGSFRNLKDDKGQLAPSELPKKYVDALMGKIVDSLSDKDKLGYFSLMEADGIPANTGKDEDPRNPNRGYGASKMTNDKAALKQSFTQAEAIELDSTPKAQVYFDGTAPELAQALGYSGSLKDLSFIVMVDDTALHAEHEKLLREFKEAGANVFAYIIKTDFVPNGGEKSAHEYLDGLGIRYEYLDYTVTNDAETENVANKLVESIINQTVTKIVPTAKIVISSPKELAVAAATLEKPNGSKEALAISNGAVDQTLTNLSDGSYKVTYIFEGKVTSTDTMKGQALVGDKVVDEKEDTRSYQAPVIETKKESRTESIAYKVVRRANEKLPEGQEKIVQKGKAGVRTITDTITLTDGKETDRKTTSQVTTEPIDEIVEYGTKKPVGQVIVHYVDTDGNTLADDRVDTAEAVVGTTYNTAENDTEKPATITKDGKTYELMSELTKGKEVGQVVEGTTEVTYVYKLKEEPKLQPKPAAPEKPTLPKTGDTTSQAGFMYGATALGLAALLTLPKKKEEQE